MSSSANEDYKTIAQVIHDNRVIFIMSPIDTEVMANTIAQLFALDAISHEPIHLYICSPGGSVMDGFAIIDAMNQTNAPVYTYSMGLVASMASIIFMHGEKRYITPNSQIMLHQPLGGFSGQASDIEITAKQILDIKKKINLMIAQKCNRAIQTVETETDRDMYLDAQSAIEYGIADAITTTTRKGV